MTNVSYKHLSATGSGILASSGAHASLVAINIGTGAAGAILDIYDGTTTGGTKIASIDASIARSYWFGGVRCPAGLFYNLTVGNADVTISYI